MGVRTAILQRLAISQNAAVERVIEGALPHAQGREQEELAAVLLQRNRRGGWIALVRRFDRLPPGVQERLLESPRELFGPLSDAMEDGGGPGRGNVVDIVRKAADPKLAFLLAEALIDGRAQVRTAAADSLLEAVRRHRQNWRQAMEEPESAGESAESGGSEHLRKAVEYGLKQFRTHQQAQAVWAALLFERQQGSLLWLELAETHEQVTRLVIGLLRELNDPALSTAVLLGLGSAVRSAAAAGLAAMTDRAVVQAVAEESYRLLDPVLRSSAALATRPRFFEALPVEVPWNEHTWIDWLRLIEGLGLEPWHKLAWLNRMAETLPAGERGRVGKLMVIRAITALKGPDTSSALLPLASDSDEVVARSATRCLLTRRNGDWRSQAGNLLQSPHGSVRKLVSMALSPGQFERLWHQYRGLPAAMQVLSTRALANADAQFGELLRSKLTSANALENAQGLKMLLAVPNITPYRDPIIALCGHNDPRIVATAVRLVGRLEDPRLRDLLELAARHRDPRVRANAVESMERLHVADRSQQVLALLNSRFSRERANAIKAISQFDFAVARECLLRMLSDPSAQHRVSALWVVGQLNLLDIARQVGTMVRRDPNPHVRKQAEELIARLQDATLTTIA